MKVVIDEATEHRSIAPMKCISRAKKRRQKKKKKRKEKGSRKPGHIMMSIPSTHIIITSLFITACSVVVKSATMNLVRRLALGVQPSSLP